LAADKKFLKELEKGCSTKEAEWEARCKLRQEELLALADTIKILNDDDALELFKKTLPGASASSFMQVQVTSENMKARAMSLLKGMRHKAKHMPARPEIDLIMLAMNGKQQGFEKVVKMIDTMVSTLGKEQADDDDKKEYCEKSIDEAEDTKKTLSEQIKDSNLAVDEMKGSLEELKGEIAKLEAGVAKLDKAVAEATEQRKKESADFDQLMSDDTAAKEILLFAKNRLNKFYNPKLYKPELLQGAPPPPPETFGAYSKKSEDSGGVVAMIDMLVADLEKEMQTAKVDEKNAQEEYEQLTADAGEKRAEDSSALTEKSSAVAETEKMLESEKGKKKDLQTELMGLMKELYALHGECDWLLKFYEVRKEARVSEIDALGKAKAVLSGADFSLLQTANIKRVSFRGSA
jgi:chromosome segregation ATPase